MHLISGEGGRLIYKKEGDHLIPCQTVKIAFNLNIREIMMITMIMIKIAKAMMMMAMPD